MKPDWKVGLPICTTGYTVEPIGRSPHDHMSHEWTMKFVEHRVADRRILRLIQKWLKAGVSEEQKQRGGNANAILAPTAPH